MEKSYLHKQKKGNSVINANGNKIVKRRDERPRSNGGVDSYFLEEYRNKRSVKAWQSA